MTSVLSMLPAADLLPPPYAVRPKAEWTGVPSTKGKGPLISIDLNEESADFGSFLTGFVTLQPRKDMLEPFTLILAISHRVSTYKSTSILTGAAKTTERSTRLTKSKIAITDPLGAGFKYTIPFAIRFPEELSLPPCQCDSPDHHHLSAPPSLAFYETNGAGSVPVLQLKMDYSVQAYIRKQTSKIAKSFRFTPTSTAMSLSGFTDASGEKLLREYSVSARRAGLLGKGPKLDISGWPVYHAADLSSRGDFSVTMRISPDSPPSEPKPTISEVEYTLVKKIVSCPDGMGSTLNQRDAVRRTSEITRTRCKPAYTWEGSEALVEIPYEIPAEQLPLVPSHAGCFTAVVYEINLVVQHSLGTSRMTLPLIINNEQTAPPLYSEAVNDSPSPEPSDSGLSSD